MFQCDSSRKSHAGSSRYFSRKTLIKSRVYSTKSSTDCFRNSLKVCFRKSYSRIPKKCSTNSFRNCSISAQAFFHRFSHFLSKTPAEFPSKIHTDIRTQINSEIPSGISPCFRIFPGIPQGISEIHPIFSLEIFVHILKHMCLRRFLRNLYIILFINFYRYFPNDLFFLEIRPGIPAENSLGIQSRVFVMNSCKSNITSDSSGMFTRSFPWSFPHCTFRNLLRNSKKKPD